MRPTAVLSWALGACVALFGSWGWLSLTAVAALDAMLVAALSYYLLARFVPDKRLNEADQGMQS